SNVILKMYNNAPGGNGNDFALDDITFRPVGPQTSISIAGTSLDSISTCGSVNLISSVETCYASNQYQWQVSINNGVWTDINQGNEDSFAVSVTAPEIYKYRLTVAQNGNIDNLNCRVNSNDVIITVPSPPVINFSTASICSGKTYTLPWGENVDSSGIYTDTLHYQSGCDSIINTVHLVVQSSTISNKSLSICEGKTYALLSGKSISQTGFYSDTLRSTSGCDSIVENVNLTVKPVNVSRQTDFICSGKNYILPWGQVATDAGTFYDTLRYSTGCDSIINSMQLLPAFEKVNNISASICPGNSYTLPWGIIVHAGGVYSDTLRYLSGCDSVITNINLAQQLPNYSKLEEPICPGQIIHLPSGKIATSPGLYNDTLRGIVSGCDSVITSLILFAGTSPPIHISKSNDLSCGYGISKLSASGGRYYIWSPASSIDNIYSAQPTVTPSVNTMYHVKVTTVEGCSGEDSVEVYVTKSNLDGDIYMPNAFTPNNDGLNDCFGVKHLGAVSNLRFAIYNRWGQLIFFTTNPRQCWNGTYAGKFLKSDTFIYQVSGNTFCGKFSKQGTVVLIR
ncbi:MAG TPA: T9SS type B sorting domain-containing protein, partial [Parafilimonas sp.]|nr:T9SS type B sorting domain-containing protein [Parafilimonas sp.]